MIVGIASSPSTPVASHKTPEGGWVRREHPDERVLRLGESLIAKPTEVQREKNNHIKLDGVAAKGGYGSVHVVDTMSRNYLKCCVFSIR